MLYFLQKLIFERFFHTGSCKISQLLKKIKLVFRKVANQLEKFYAYDRDHLAQAVKGQRTA